jgi:hypothetical protein
VLGELIKGEFGVVKKTIGGGLAALFCKGDVCATTRAAQESARIALAHDLSTRSRVRPAAAITGTDR